jgi:hypothetical protein
MQLLARQRNHQEEGLLPRSARLRRQPLPQLLHLPPQEGLGAVAAGGEEEQQLPLAAIRAEFHQLAEEIFLRLEKTRLQFRSCSVLFPQYHRFLKRSSMI